MTDRIISKIAGMFAVMIAIVVIMAMFPVTVMTPEEDADDIIPEPDDPTKEEALLTAYVVVNLNLTYPLMAFHLEVFLDGVLWYDFQRSDGNGGHRLFSNATIANIWDFDPIEEHNVRMVAHVVYSFNNVVQYNIIVTEFAFKPLELMIENNAVVNHTKIAWVI